MYKQIENSGKFLKLQFFFKLGHSNDQCIKGHEICWKGISCQLKQIHITHCWKKYTSKNRGRG